MASTELQMVLDMLRLGSPLAGTTIHEMRANMEATAGAVPPPPDVRFETVRMGGVPAEWTRADGADGSGALLYLHGGGYCVGSIGTHRLLVSELARACGIPALSLDYRLAPEHPFPAAADDAFAATQFVAEHAADFGVDPSLIAVGGDSAGGNLATVVALRARDAGGPALAFQLLVYPLVDFTDHDSGSMREFAEGHFLTTAIMDYFADHYLPPGVDRRQPWVSPLKANLAGLPPASVLTAECDPLRDQGEAFAERLKQAGVQTALKRYDGMIHPFFGLGGIFDGAREAVADASAALKAALTR